MTKKRNGGEQAAQMCCKVEKNIFIRNIGRSQMRVNYLNPFLIVFIGKKKSQFSFCEYLT